MLFVLYDNNYDYFKSSAMLTEFFLKRSLAV